jgi:hypothetical protein
MRAPRLALIALGVCGLMTAAYFVTPGATQSASLSTAVTYPIEWLDERLTLEEIERKYTAKPDGLDSISAAALNKPFGYQNARWEALKARMQPGDELWTFASPADSWKHLAGRAGIALVRDNKMVDAIVTILN